MRVKRALPDDVFHVFAGLLSEFVRIGDSCELTAIDLFILWYLKHNGRTLGGSADEWFFLRHEFTELLNKEFAYSDSDVHTHLDRLENKGLVRRTHITEVERDALFGSPDGQKIVVKLLPEGVQKIEQFKSGINDLFSNKVRHLPLHLRLPFEQALPLITNVAAWVLKRSGHTRDQSKNYVKRAGE